MLPVGHLSARRWEKILFKQNAVKHSEVGAVQQSGPPRPQPRRDLPKEACCVPGTERMFREASPLHLRSLRSAGGRRQQVQVDRKKDRAWCSEETTAGYVVTRNDRGVGGASEGGSRAAEASLREKHWRGYWWAYKGIPPAGMSAHPSSGQTL